MKTLCQAVPAERLKSPPVKGLRHYPFVRQYFLQSRSQQRCRGGRALGSEQPLEDRDADCPMRFWKDTSGRYLDPGAVKALLKDGLTPILDGFTAV